MGVEPGAPAWYVGLMTGTSLDGIDAVLAQCGEGGIRIAAHHAAPLPGPLRAELLALNTPGADELHRAALASNALAEAYAAATTALLADAGLAPAAVRAIGAHGQTVRHRPELGYTLQLNNPALLAERTGIAVVADFRSRDVAAGGQGAPLVPAFHHAVFGGPEPVAVLNLGGIANLSILHGDRATGFDCGPANALMDHWCQRHTGRPYDADGAWAASGYVQPALLGALRDDPFFVQAPPKSTGRDRFNPHWLSARLAGFDGLAPADVQATLAELTAGTCADALTAWGGGAATLLLCGGGALNAHLVQRIQLALPRVSVESTADHGLPPLQVEAAAFAWLAWRHVEGLPGSLPAVTGAAGPRILGAYHPA